MTILLQSFFFPFLASCRGGSRPARAALWKRNGQDRSLQSRRGGLLRFAPPGQTGASRHFGSAKALGVAALPHSVARRPPCHRRAGALLPPPPAPAIIAPCHCPRRCHCGPGSGPGWHPQSPAAPSLNHSGQTQWYKTGTARQEQSPCPTVTA